MSTFSALKLELIGTGEASGTWGSTTNDNLTAIQQAISGAATLDSGDFTANVATLTLTNSNSQQDARALVLKIASGAVSAAGTVNVPAVEKPIGVINASAHTVTVKVSGQTGVAVPAGATMWLYNDGVDVIQIINTLNAPTLNNMFLVGAREKITVSATAATGTINYDAVTQSVLYYTSNASANWTVNLRGNDTTSLNTLMAVGDTLTVTFLVTTGATAYFNNAFQIDGTAVTPKWSGGLAPASGNASSVESYVYVAVKTGNAAFTVFASRTQFK
jgi:hypothetical protein